MSLLEDDGSLQQKAEHGLLGRVSERYRKFWQENLSETRFL